jgi:hypothetical protein
MKNLTIFLIILTCTVYSCRSNELKGNLKYDFTTSGALGDDCFQVIISASPDTELKTMAEQRENAFIKAKNSISSETERQMLDFYLSSKSIKPDNIPLETVNSLKKKSGAYSKKGIIEQEYYQMDNTVILVYRIFKNGIKNEILNN